MCPQLISDMPKVASLAAMAVAESRSFALVTHDTVVDPGQGPAQLERVLDILARVDFDPTARLPVPPVDPQTCILVSMDGAPGFGDLLVIGRDAVLERAKEPTAA